MVDTRMGCVDLGLFPWSSLGDTWIVDKFHLCRFAGRGGGSSDSKVRVRIRIVSKLVARAKVRKLNFALVRNQYIMALKVTTTPGMHK